MNEIDYAVLAMDVYKRVESKGMFPDGQDVDRPTVGTLQNLSYLGSYSGETGPHTLDGTLSQQNPGSLAQYRVRR
jgi:hypothetical protein